MSKDFVKSVLKAHLDAGMPRKDPWPAIRQRVQTRSTGRRTWWGISMRPVAFAVAGAMIVVLALAGSLLWTTQPETLDAEQLWAKTEQASQSTTTSETVKSVHMVSRYRYRFENMTAFAGGGAETWYQAPGRRFDKTRSWGVDGVAEDGFSLQEGLAWYQARPGSDVVELTALDEPVRFGSLSLLEATEGIKDHPRVKNAYTLQIIGKEQIAGRNAYVLESLIRPEVSREDRARITTHKQWIWIDQELYVVLKQLLWNEAGDLIEEQNVDLFELNKPVDSALFTLPTGYVVADMRAASMEERTQGWRDVYSKMNVTLYEPGDLARYGPELRKPYFLASQGVVSQALVRKPGPDDIVNAVIVQGPASAIDVSRLGKSTGVRVGPYQGKLFGADANRLVFDIGSTRVLIYDPVSPYDLDAYPGVADELVRIGESLVAVPKK